MYLLYLLQYVTRRDEIEERSLTAELDEQFHIASPLRVRVSLFIYTRANRYIHAGRHTSTICPIANIRHRRRTHLAARRYGNARTHKHRCQIFLAANCTDSLLNLLFKLFLSHVDQVFRFH